MRNVCFDVPRQRCGLRGGDDQAESPCGRRGRTGCWRYESDAQALRSRPTHRRASSRPTRCPAAASSGFGSSRSSNSCAPASTRTREEGRSGPGTVCSYVQICGTTSPFVPLRVSCGGHRRRWRGPDFQALGPGHVEERLVLDGECRHPLMMGLRRVDDGVGNVGFEGEIGLAVFLAASDDAGEELRARGRRARRG